MGFCACTFKYFLFLVNFVIVLCGLALVILGSLAYTHGKSLLSVNGKFSAPSLAIIAIGVIIFVIAFFGCCGALRDSSCMISTYAVLLLTILVVEVVIAILAFVYQNKAEEMLGDSLRQLFDKYDEKIMKDEVDSIQINFECCGYNGPTDWIVKLQQPPPSCYPNQKPSLSIYGEGCGVAVIKRIKYWLKTLGGVGIGIACVEGLAVVFSLCLASSIRRGNRY